MEILPTITAGGSHEGNGPPSQTDTLDNQQAEEVYAMSTMFGVNNVPEDENYIQIYKATSDPNTMYHHEAMRAPDADKFREVMQSEWKGQAMNKNFSLIRRSQVPEEPPPNQLFGK